MKIEISLKYSNKSDPKECISMILDLIFYCQQQKIDECIYNIKIKHPDKNVLTLLAKRQL